MTLCPHCHTDLNAKPLAELPVATALGVSYCGRRLFSVAGKPGLWCAKRDYLEPDTEAVECQGEVDGRCRGKPRRRTLYLLREVTEETRKAVT